MTAKNEPTCDAQPFGRLEDGRAASLYTLENSMLRVEVTDYGGRMVRIEAPDRSGKRGDVLLGFDDAPCYERAGAAFGALLGRCANRIAGGAFTLDGRTHELATNDRGATLHGGPVGFARVLWRRVAASPERLVLAHVSPDGDQGFPGELAAEAIYRLEGDELSLELSARTRAPTLVNLSAHPYFNLAGAARDDVLDHEVTIAAESFLPTDDKQIPTGEIRPVAGTPFDFRRGRPIGARIREADPQLLYGQGYDICYVLSAAPDVDPAINPGTLPDRTPRVAARLHAPSSGRTLDIETTQPALQIYTGNKLDGSIVGRDGIVYRQSAGLAVEAQGFPDAPHHANFPSTVLRPGETYRALIRYRFGVR
jgi:aldose 1-epimerase